MWEQFGGPVLGPVPIFGPQDWSGPDRLQSLIMSEYWINECSGSARSPSDLHRRPESDHHDQYHPPSSGPAAVAAEEEEEMKREVHLSATATKILYFEGDEKSVVDEHFSRCGYGDGAKESVVSEKGKDCA